MNGRVLLGACRRARRDERSHKEEPKPRTRPSDNHLHRPKIDMDMRDSFSRLKKKLKRPLTGGRRKPERAGADVVGGGIDEAGPLQRSEPHPEVRVEGTESVGRSYPSPSAPSVLDSGKPGIVSVAISDPDAAGEGVGVYPEVQVEGTENVGRSYPSPSAPSILESGKPDST